MQARSPLKGGDGSYWSRIHREESSWISGLVLGFFSIFYGAAVRLRLGAYGAGFLRKKRLPGFVVSMGNLTTGGTGKTPATIMLAKWAAGRGYRVAVLSRGYGGRYRDRVLVVSDGERVEVDAVESGDEAYLIAKRLSGIPVVLSKERFLAGSLAHDKFGSDFFILDDGYQHLELQRDVNLMLMDADNPFGNGRLLPRGPLREPLNQLARADAVLITRSGRQGGQEKTLDIVRGIVPEIPAFFADHVADKVIFPHSGEVRESGFLRGKRVLAFAGIARPEEFRDTLVKLGADPVHFEAYRDHYQFKEDEIRSLAQKKKDLDAQLILTTEKDWVRTISLVHVPHDMAYLSIRFVLRSVRDDFFKMIEDGMKGEDG